MWSFPMWNFLQNHLLGILATCAFMQAVAIALWLFAPVSCSPLILILCTLVIVLALCCFIASLKNRFLKIGGKRANDESGSCIVSE